MQTTDTQDDTKCCDLWTPNFSWHCTASVFLLSWITERYSLLFL